MSRADILIVGAGPTGLVLALRLARHGVAFRIIDKNSGPGQASRAMAVQARTLELYRQMGIADEVVSKGIKIESIHIRENGKEFAHMNFGELKKDVSPYPFALSFPQDDHERFLTEKLRDYNIAVEWNTELTGFSQDANSVQANLIKNGLTEIYEASYICGCDGAHSAVRHGLNLKFEGGTYDQLFYVADATIASGFQKDGFVTFGNRGLLLMLPVRSRGAQRFIGTVPPEFKEKQGLTFENLRPTTEKLLGVNVDEVNWFSTYHVHHRVAEKFRVGRAFLAGDAGHIHSPAGGQGMNTGIGDAVNLSWKLAHVIQGRAKEDILNTYETERIRFARQLVSTTDRAFRSIVSESGAGQFLRTQILPRVMPVLTRFAFVRRAFFNLLSQNHIHYAESYLSEGQAGNIRAGDRLPWLVNGNGGNFANLNGTDWQLQVYGTPNKDFIDEASRLKISTDIFEWNDKARSAGFAKDAAYLIRPDGYVAIAAVHQNPDILNIYAEKIGSA